jgi:hypothetical protein
MSIENKTYEEIYGLEKAKKIKEKISRALVGKSNLGKKGKKPWNYGKKWSKSTIKKIRESHKGKIGWNRNLTKETDKRIMNISKSLMGHCLSKKTREKIGKSNKGKGAGYNKGKTYEEIFGKEKAEKIKIKISKFSKKRRHSEKTKNKIRISCKGQKRTKKTKVKISLSKMGVKNPAFNNWSSYEPYNPQFDEVFKDYIRERERNKCFFNNSECSMDNKLPHVHHIDYNKQNSKEDNCMALCSSHHAKTAFNREYWKKYLKEQLIQKYPKFAKDLYISK